MFYTPAIEDNVGGKCPSILFNFISFWSLLQALIALHVSMAFLWSRLLELNIRLTFTYRCAHLQHKLALQKGIAQDI